YLIQSQRLSSFFSDCHRVALSAVPCQWERIIGSYFGLTSVKCKKMTDRSHLNQNINPMRFKASKCVFNQQKSPEIKDSGLFVV
ncbi:hypothetical protein ACLEDU_15195, partial [Lonsdalea quercina]|uniref:hypothetical protein n=2 Tax=Lonsdalea quercina TaxID=71657 RepID=UPI0039750176